VRAILADLEVAAVKTGMLATADIIEAVAELAAAGVATPGRRPGDGRVQR
jgi:hydroxymethylpyrimidine/phosphomethylpyrimidine kinase